MVDLDYKNIKKLIIEMLFVGITLSMLGFLVTYIIKIIVEIYNGNDICNVYFFPSHSKGMFSGLFFTGALYHLICEYTGLNHWYVKQYVKIF